MKRALVLTNEAARHPFRRSLPPPRFAQRSRAAAHLCAVSAAAVLMLSVAILAGGA